MVTIQQGNSQVGTPSQEGLPIETSVVFFSSLILLLGTVIIATEISSKMAMLYLIGSGLGIALYHGAFGFTAGWRRLVTLGDGRGMRAQLLVIGLTMLAFIPLINFASDYNLSLVGSIAPVGASLIFGSFIFGLGMQLGNGCGSGTLFTVGGGSKRMVITLLSFVTGSVIGSFHLPWWLSQASIDPVNLANVFSVWGALALQAVLLFAIAYLTILRERSVGFKASDSQTQSIFTRLFRGPWSILWAGLVLVILNILTLIIAGHPWTITYGFAVWGAKLAQGVGVDMTQFEFWTWAKPAQSLKNSILADVTSVMNFGLIAGAMLASGMAGKFAPPVKLSTLAIVSAIVGGLLMGYGARLAFGCNIGAFLGGIASGSLHGWIWFIFAFIGSIIGIRLRPMFGLN